ncbi:MAG: cupin domain-containing protein [Pseudomonadota bacterium]
MKPISKTDRRVVNIRDEDAWTAWDEGAEPGTSFIKLNKDMPRDVGFYIYRMAPGTSSTPHLHPGAEEFLMVEGEITDNDGTVYRAGDVVWLAPGTEHNSRTETGAIIAVFAEASEEAPGGSS